MLPFSVVTLSPRWFENYNMTSLSRGEEVSTALPDTSLCFYCQTSPSDITLSPLALCIGSESANNNPAAEPAAQRTTHLSGPRNGARSGVVAAGSVAGSAAVRGRLRRGLRCGAWSVFGRPISEWAGWRPPTMSA